MKRLALLDFVKFASIIFIVFHHFQQFTGLRFDHGINFSQGRWYFGLLCELFFMISGFLCVHIESRNSMKDTSPLRKFVLRWERLGPPVFIVNLVTLLLAWFFFLIKGYWWQDRTYTIFEGIKGIFLLDYGPIFGESTAPLNTSWVISYILVCYFIFYLGQMTKNDKLFYAVFLFVSCMMANSGITIPVFFTNWALRGFVSFFIGVFLYYFVNNTDYKIILKITSFFSIIIIVGLLTGYLRRHVHGIYILNDYPKLLVYVIFPIIVMNLGHPVMYIQHFENLGRYLGDLCFYVYIIHFPGMLFGRLCADLICGDSYNATFDVWTMITYTIIVIIVAGVFKKLVGDPLRKYVKKLDGRVLEYIKTIL